MPIQKITKEEIINRCLLVFLKQGYHKTTMDDLAKACGLFKGSFYYYFSSKELLMRSILEYSLAFVQKNLFSIAYDEALSYEERLEKLFEMQKNMLLGNEGGCLFGNMTLETAMVVPEFKESLKAFFDNWETALTHIFQSKFTPEQATLQAEQSIIAIEGAMILVRARGENRYLENVYERILKELRVRK